MSTHPRWKRATQVKLIAELQGFWAEDLWDMHHSLYRAGTWWACDWQKKV